MKQQARRAAATAAGIGTMAVLMGLTGGAAQATVVTIANPGGSTEIAAALRWANTGQEAGIRDGSTFTTNLNPAGTPAWQLNQNYRFDIQYAASTGTLKLSVDFNRNGAFDVGEVIQQSTFVAPGLTNYSGYGFNVLQITGNESGSTARSTLSNLMINGQPFGSISPLGTFAESFYDDTSGGPSEWNIAGSMLFSTPGTSQERPSWNFAFRGAALMPVAGQVPLPGSAPLMLAGLGVAGLILRRRRAG